MKPTVEIVTANKKLISELRAMDTHNRQRRRDHVLYLRREIREGRWCITNQGIGVSASNYITDGGHRLEAIEQEGCPPVQFILARGLPDEAQKFVDQHAKRSMADVLRLLFNKQYSNTIVGAVHCSMRMKASDKSTKFSPDEFAAEFEERAECISDIMQISKIVNLSAPVIAALLDVYESTKNPAALDFAIKVIRGEMLEHGDPALTLRNWLQSPAAKAAGHVANTDKYLKSRNALLAALAGRKLSKLYATGG